MLSVSALSVHFGGVYLFNNVSFIVTPGDKIGLVGKNGAGKSTLLRLAAGETTPMEGEVTKPNGFTIGYLPQEMHHTDGRTVMEEALTAFTDLQQLQMDIARMDEAVATTTDTSSDNFMDLLQKLHDANMKFGDEGGYTMEGRAEQVLQGLGFLRSDFNKDTATFSGGWRMRVELAKMLLQNPDLLLLDEPTNHLDIESIRWLENYLHDWHGSILLVSHDKVFLDSVTNRTIEINAAKVYDYKAPYSRYLEMREERMGLQKAAFVNQQKAIADAERFIERFKAKASKATQAQSRQKMLDKVERIEIDADDTSSMRFRFPEPPRAGQVVVEMHGIQKKYGTHEVLKGLNLELSRGDKVAFVGKNGEGKSTLSKILIGMETPTAGEVKLGHNVQIGYYAQNQADALSGDRTVLQTIDDAARGDMRTQVRSLLGAFLFSGTAVEKKVKVLSGGEKARLALAKLLLEPINLLVMDEPTNHLDMRSKDILKEALVNYTGTLVVVSHDRDFLQGLTQKVIEFRGGTLKTHIGDVYDYLEARKIEELDDLQKGGTATPQAGVPLSLKSETPAQAAKPSPAPQVVDRTRDRASENARRKIAKEIEGIEDEIEKLESNLKTLEEKLATHNEPAKQKELLASYQKCGIDLTVVMAKWEDAGKRMDAA